MILWRYRFINLQDPANRCGYDYSGEQRGNEYSRKTEKRDVHKAGMSDYRRLCTSRSARRVVLVRFA